MHAIHRRTVAALLAAGLLAAIGVGHPLQPLAADGPCDQVSGAPDPPGGGPDPEIAGTVTDANTSSSIEGATMKLYRCYSATPVYLTSDTTDSSGQYAFTSLTPQRYYYVEAALTGPLSGKAPAEGTENPTDPIAIGSSHTDVDFSFE